MFPLERNSCLVHCSTFVADSSQSKSQPDFILTNRSNYFHCVADREHRRLSDYTFPSQTPHYVPFLSTVGRLSEMISALICTWRNTIPGQTKYHYRSDRLTVSVTLRRSRRFGLEYCCDVVELIIVVVHA